MLPKFMQKPFPVPAPEAGDRSYMAWAGRTASPVLVTVPHAGREYATGLVASARGGLPALQRLEDRFADRLVAPLIEDGFAALIAQVPRAAIDLNRDERDIDTQMIRHMPKGWPLTRSAKQRGGLGLFPRRAGRQGDLWTGPLDWDEAHRRIESVHRPYHAAIEERLRMFRQTRGVALLLDIHSMPPLPGDGAGGTAPDIVIGDRYGASCESRLSAIARMVLGDHGYKVALNHPYPGYYTLDRHGKPGRGIHAMQIEISRRLYLDSELDHPVAAPLEQTGGALRDLAHALGEELHTGQWPIAAE